MNNIEDLLEEFSAEAVKAKWSFYTWKNIHDMASQDQNIYQAINKNAASWNIILHSLQTTFLITLGRVLDVNDKKALTINSFIDTCIKEIDQFSLIELEKRKRLTWKDATENEMESYLREAYEPTKDDFNSLKKAAEQHIKNHTEIYKPIRNKLLAHKNISFLQKSNDLFANTNVRDIEATLLFLHQVVSVVRQLLIDGTKTNLKDYCLRLDNDLMKKDIEQILEKLI